MVRHDAWPVWLTFGLTRAPLPNENTPDARRVGSKRMLAGSASVSSGFYRRETVNAIGEPRRPLDVAGPKRVPHVVESVRVVQRQIWCPAALGLHEIHVHL